MMDGYLVRILSRMLETETQKAIPNANLFVSRAAADEFYRKITSEPYRFHPDQIAVHRISFRLEEAIRYVR